MKNKLLLFALLTIALSACHNNGQKGEAVLIEINPEDIQNVEITNAFNSVKAFRFKQTGDSFIGSIDQLIGHDNRYFVLDKATQSIFIFSEDGSLIKKINRVGRGPMEYLQASGLSINTFTKELYLTDNSSLKTFIMDYDGNIKNSLKNEFVIKDIVFTSADEMIIVKDKVNSGATTGYLLNLYDKNKSVDTFLPFEYNQGENIFDYYHPVITTSSSQAYYQTMFNNTISRISREGVLPIYKISFTKNGIPAGIMNEKSSGEIGRFVVENKWKYACNPYLIDILNNNLIINFVNKASAFYCFYDMNTKASKVLSFSISKDLSLNVLSKASFYNKNGVFFFVIDQYLFDGLNDDDKEQIKTTFPSLYELLYTGTLNDNPVIIETSL